MALNLNELAKQVSELESGKAKRSIAEIEEFMRCVFVCLGDYIDNGDVWNRHQRVDDVIVRCMEAYNEHEDRKGAKS